MAKMSSVHRSQSEVSINKLHLDSQNPRHDPLEDENKIIAQLCMKEQVLNLAKDIVDKGELNPLESTGIIEMEHNPGHYIVVEGNRRVCALKLLQDPQKAPNPKIRADLEDLVRNFEVPPKLAVVIFPDRETARPWIGLRHLGAQNGAGTRQWDAMQKSRYDNTSSPNQLALAVVDRAIEFGWINTAQREQLAITTLTRYLSNPLVREALGLGDNRNLQYTHEILEVDAALQQFLEDAIPKSDDNASQLVHSRSNKLDREHYARQLRERGVAPKTLLPSPVSPPPPQKTRKKSTNRTKQHPDNRKFLMPSDFVMHHHDKSLLRLRKELRISPIDEHVFAINYLLRAFIERVMVLYAKYHKAHHPNMKDNKLIEACIKQLEQEKGISDSDLKSMRVACSNKNAAHSLHTLGAAVHANHLPTRNSLIATWDNWEKALRLMLDKLETTGQI